MTDCIKCGFPNPSSVGLVVCRNCGSSLPTESRSEPPPNPPGPWRDTLSSLYRRADVLRLVAWGSAAVASLASVLFWLLVFLGQCNFTELKQNAEVVTGSVMFVMGFVALVSLLVLSTKTANPREKRAAVWVAFLGMGINFYLFLDAGYRAMTFAVPSC